MKLVYRHSIWYRCTLGYCGSFFEGAEANCRLQWHTGQTIVDTTASLHKLAAGRKLATTHLNVSNRQMCGCTGFKSGGYNKSYYNRPFKNDTGL